jgi:hypothetical protein
MYDKFDDDIEKSGLRFDGNEPTFNRRKIHKIVKRSIYISIGIIFAVVFVMRQRYNIDERDINSINTHGTIHEGFTSVRDSFPIRERTVRTERGTVVVSRIHYIDGGGGNAQIRFHLLVPNPFYGGDLMGLTLNSNLGNRAGPIPETFVKRFWGCQMLNVTFTFTEATIPPVSGETFSVNIRGEGIATNISLVMP